MWWGVGWIRIRDAKPRLTAECRDSNDLGVSGIECRHNSVTFARNSRQVRRQGISFPMTAAARRSSALFSQPPSRRRLT
jgi:hypothetical protein